MDVVEGTATKYADLLHALSGIHTTYYQLHSINLGSNFEDIGGEVARNFATAGADSWFVKIMDWLGNSRASGSGSSAAGLVNK